MKNKPYPLYTDIPRVYTIQEIVEIGRTKGGDKPFATFVDLETNEPYEITFTDGVKNIENLGTYFFSLGLRNTKVAIIGQNCEYWSASFYANIVGGNVVVPLDKELPPSDIAYIIKDSGCTGIVYTDKYQHVIDYLKADPECPIQVYVGQHEFRTGMQKGAELIASGEREFLEHQCKPEDLACIAYTSGTTGRNKGVMLTHKNICAALWGTSATVKGGYTVSFLPMNHSFSWVSAIFSGFLYQVGGFITPSIDHLVEDFQKYHPQHFSAVPLVAERIYNTIWDTAKKTGREEVLKKGLRISRFLMKFGIDVRRKLFKEVHKNLGGNLEMIYVGGAHLDIKYQQGLYDLGILVLAGYGLTECAPAVTANRNHHYKFGSVGRALPCNEIKIHEPDADGIGEIYVRGDNVMQGYYNDPESTAEAFDGDWFKTGDYGWIDKDGFLFITGRKKNLIIRGNGKNVAPEELEAKLMQIPYVAEVLVYEEDNRIAAEFFLNESKDENAKEKLQADVDAINAQNAKYKRIGIVKTRDTEFPKTTTLKIARKYREQNA